MYNLVPCVILDIWFNYIQLLHLCTFKMQIFLKIDTLNDEILLGVIVYKKDTSPILGTK